MARSSSTASVKFVVRVVGASGVGKTCLTTRLCEREMPEHPVPTIFFNIMYYQCNTDDIDIPTSITFYDTSQDIPHQVQTHLTRIVDSYLYYSHSHAIIFMYDLSRPETLDYIVDLWRLYLDRMPILRGNKPMFLLVGNKYDLVSDQVNAIEVAARKHQGKRHKKLAQKLTTGQREEYEKLKMLIAEMDRVGVLRIVYMSVLCNRNSTLKNIVNNILIASALQLQHPDDTMSVLQVTRKRMAAYTNYECGRFVHDASICSVFEQLGSNVDKADEALNEAQCESNVH